MYPATVLRDQLDYASRPKYQHTVKYALFDRIRTIASFDRLDDARMIRDQFEGGGYRCWIERTPN